MSIYCIMGKSASGKDTIYNRLLTDDKLGLTKIVPATTRPIRSGEADGETYRFFSDQEYEELCAKQPERIIESRAYHTVHGIWHYFTLADEIDPKEQDYIYIGTLEAYTGLRRYYGEACVRPIYLYLADDGERLQRALDRERAQQEPKYAELCRRFLGDEEDFSPEKIEAAAIPEDAKFENSDLESTTERIREWILG